MQDQRNLFTSESVSIGHPDKIADQISDAVLDEVLGQDPEGRVACETFLKGNLAVVGGEITADADLNIPELVREVVVDIGYTRPELGFDPEANVLVSLNKQSEDIAQGVDEGDEKELGAGDMGIMFGYACRETPELMPLPLMLARSLTDRLTEVRKQDVIDYLRPDGKAQVTVEYDAHKKPKRVDTVVVAAQHEPNVDDAQLKQDIKTHVIEGAIDLDLLDENTTYHINPTGDFVKGGPAADTGLTGRKVIVDTYGGMGNHGGGCFAGKDPTKVDRTGAFAARHAAKNIVAAELADQCEVQLSYAIGRPEPVSISVDTFGTGTVENGRIREALKESFDFTPRGIIERFKLQRPIFLQTTRDGHLGCEGDPYLWENTDAAEQLRDIVNTTVTADV